MGRVISSVMSGASDVPLVAERALVRPVLFREADFLVADEVEDALRFRFGGVAFFAGAHRLPIMFRKTAHIFFSPILR